MKFLLNNWFIVLVAVVSGAMLLWETFARSGGGSAVSTAEAVRLINREKGVLIDVSEPAEFAGGHAVGARNIPFGTLEDAKKLPTNKALPLIVMCGTGSRATKAVDVLRKRGHANVVSVAGGLAGWREANLPVEKA